MQRRKFIRQAAGFGLAVHPLTRLLKTRASDGPKLTGARLKESHLTGPKQPVFVYNNWSAYDELSDRVPQTEALAMRELNEILRLKKNGVQIDYYVMDAFWFDKWGGYRTWRPDHWPNGPGKWLKACRDNQIKPGMWFSSNLIATHDGRFLEPVPAWKDSVGTDPNILCLFEGGYLPHLADTLQLWYDQGVRLFKFDFAYFEAVTPASKDKFTAEEIKEKNKSAFMRMLQDFRAKNEEVLITGYNGFGGDMENTFTPFRKTVDDRWLDTFDTLYCGDPRFSDVPMMNCWRSQDNYSDHMVRQFECNGLPLRRIDNCAFMIGMTGTCYYRGVHAWKGMLILELARGGWMNVYHGNLELLTDADAGWFARAQGLYRPLQERDTIRTFGAIPGTGKPYGFAGMGEDGMLYTVVNPSQEVAAINMEGLPGWGHKWFDGTISRRVLYADSGYLPSFEKTFVTLGPEQLIVVGAGSYARERYELGKDASIRIPRSQEKLAVDFVVRGKNRVGGVVQPGGGKSLRILFQQFGVDGYPVRSWGGSPPDGQNMNALLQIRARQAGKELPLYIQYDKMIWSGLSWAAGELRQGSFDPVVPVDVECVSMEKAELRLDARIYAVSY